MFKRHSRVTSKSVWLFIFAIIIQEHLQMRKYKQKKTVFADFSSIYNNTNNNMYWLLDKFLSNHKNFIILVIITTTENKKSYHIRWSNKKWLDWSMQDKRDKILGKVPLQRKKSISNFQTLFWSQNKKMQKSFIRLSQAWLKFFDLRNGFSFFPRLTPKNLNNVFNWILIRRYICISRF